MAMHRRVTRTTVASVGMVALLSAIVVPIALGLWDMVHSPPSPSAMRKYYLPYLIGGVIRDEQGQEVFVIEHPDEVVEVKELGEITEGNVTVYKLRLLLRDLQVPGDVPQYQAVISLVLVSYGVSAPRHRGSIYTHSFEVLR